MISMNPKLTPLFVASVLSIAPLSAVAQEAPQSPPWNQADEIHGEDAMADAREEVLAEGGDQQNFYILFNQLEAQITEGDDDFVWNGQAWYGGDINKLWFKSEGRASLNGGEVDDAEIQVLYSRAIAPFWDVQAGLRYDIEPDGLAHGVVALNGLAPYWFEVDASAFLSEKGDLTARVEAEYELLLTQRLILQPRIEANLSAQDIPKRETGSGLNSIDAGLRLRYEFKREVAPYIGVEWQSAFGETRDMIKAAGRNGDEVVFLAGLRTWY
ncbi:copper resistance protein B [Hyphomonas sp.]|jgi:copper resistance protein B|uniref:copper resistance protein B n=1 Tax=Hyphomonas sp. TaxID=87 RepID=UPI002605A1AF|nr:copper resistance protein B [Hyphomonas sp.]MDF1806213.1 copper resistance protein B [Hyphomonas sp.]